MSEQLVYVKKGNRSEVIAKREASLSKKRLSQANTSQIAFTLYVIAIAAKLANVDESSQNIDEQIVSFKEIFSIPDSELEKVDVFYKDAVEDGIDAAHYAHQLTNLFPNNRLLLEELIDDLFIFADADGTFTDEKAKFLKQIVCALKFNENYFSRALRRHRLNTNGDPFRLLNVSNNVSYVDLKKAFRRAIIDCHPDKFARSDIMPEIKELALEQFNLYTQAYEAIKNKKAFTNNTLEKK
jgi:DnaJ like chaperone protein